MIHTVTFIINTNLSCREPAKRTFIPTEENLTQRIDVLGLKKCPFIHPLDVNARIINL